MTQSAVRPAGQAALAGITWSVVAQAVEVGISLGAMLILARLIAPEEYGRFGAMLGILIVINVFSSGVFSAQALQLPEGQAPDWGLHWTAGFYIQVTLVLACNVAAGVCWLVPHHRPLAPLLHLASVGLLIDWPAQLRRVMLERGLHFRRLRVALMVAAVARLAVTATGAVLGWGAYALVLGANMVTAVPLAGDLLASGWRPPAGWWRWPLWSAYRPALQFGLQQVASGLLTNAHGVVTSIVLPPVAGFAAIGLLGRAQALFGATVWRAGAVLIEVLYPLLPRAASDPVQYQRRATLFARAVLLTVLPGAVYVGVKGPVLSRALYGERWVAADPLIWPAALGGVGVAVLVVSTVLLLAVNRLRTSLLLNALSAGMTLPAAAVALAGRGIVGYAWTAMAGDLLAAAVAWWAATAVLGHGCTRAVLLPPVAVSGVAAGAVLIFGRLGPILSPMLDLLTSTAVFALVGLLVLRALFPETLRVVLDQLPAGAHLRTWLWLPPRASSVGAR